MVRRETRQFIKRQPGFRRIRSRKTKKQGAEKVITDEMLFIIWGYFSLIGSWVRQNFSAPKEEFIKLPRMPDDSIEGVIDRLRA